MAMNIPKILKYLTIIVAIALFFSILSVVGNLPSVKDAFDKALATPSPTPLSFWNPYNPDTNSTLGGFP